MNIDYTRVIPRDLFNEAKLLKCLGVLTLKIHDNQAPEGLKVEQTNNFFKIGLTDDGSLKTNSLEFTYKDEFLSFQTTYNSKNNFPLYCYFDYCEYLVFDEKGNFNNEFIEFLTTI